MNYIISELISFIRFLMNDNNNNNNNNDNIMETINENNILSIPPLNPTNNISIAQTNNEYNNINYYKGK